MHLYAVRKTSCGQLGDDDRTSMNTEVAVMTMRQHTQAGHGRHTAADALKLAHYKGRLVTVKQLFSDSQTPLTGLDTMEIITVKNVFNNANLYFKK